MTQRRRRNLVVPALLNTIIVCLAGSPRTSFADSTVVFNEIMYHPLGDETQLEWIEFHNQMAVNMDLSGWSMAGGIEFSFPEKTIVPGGGFLLVAASPEALEAATGLQGVLGPFAGALENAGGRLELRNNNDRLMDAVEYKSIGSWPAAADGSGASLAKRDPNAASWPARNWVWSSTIGGTPGAHNFSGADPGAATKGLVSLWSLDDPALGAGTYREDFAEPDGIPQDWLGYQGDVSIAAGTLRLTSAAGVEAFAWAGTGATPTFFGAIRSVTFRTIWTGQPGDEVGRHGGAVIACSEPSNRWSASLSGYCIDWIDRVGDHGYRVIKMTNGVHTGIGSVGAPAAPGAVWRIDFDAAGFTLSVDGQVMGTFADTSYRAGYVGVWCYQNAGQEIRFDDVAIEHTGSARDTVDGNNGTVGAGAIRVEGVVGAGAGAFDNTSAAFIDVGRGTGNNFSVRNGVTIEAVIVPAWSGERFEYDTIFRKDDASGSLLLGFQHDGIEADRDIAIIPAEQPVLSFGLKVGGTYRELDMPLDGADGRPSLAGLKDGLPHHVAATYDAASGVKALHVDGVRRFSAQLTPGSLVASGGTASAFIGNGGSRGEAFNGVIDEVAFWSRALTATEVLQHHDNVEAGLDYFAGTGEDAQTGDPPIRFSEVLAGAGADSWIELANEGGAPFKLDGCILASLAAPAAPYTFAARTLASGELLAIGQPELGFAIAVGDRLFLYAPGQTQVIAGVGVFAPHIGWAGEPLARWLYPDAPTRGAANSFDLRDEIVISEIMYHPMADPDERGEYVELFNRSDRPVDLSGFRIGDGILFSFPEGVIIGAGEYVVVARDPDWLRGEHGIANVLGPFEGRLDDGGERIELFDARGNVADSVHYYDGGHWHEYADGGGSSLELRDPWADSSRPEAWAASDESAKSSWKTYSYRATATADGGPTRWNEFVMGLLDTGEILIDDISVKESPSGAAVEILQNGSFETGTNAWRILGNHGHSEAVPDPGSPAAKVLHLVATGPTEHMLNHAETTYVGNKAIVNGREYQISFRAKWLAGSNLLNTRLYFNRCPRTTAIDVPGRRGTPGRRNSAFEPNIGPTYRDLSHAPAIPDAGRNVTVTIAASDPDGVAGCTLWWSVNGGAWASAAMAPAGGDRYAGTIPGQGTGQIVQFYVQGADTKGAISVHPPGGPDSRALYKVNDGLARLERMHNLRIVMTPADTSLLHRETNVMSDDLLGATVYYDEKEIFYDVGCRLKSSERGRLSNERVGFNVHFQPERKLRGVHDSVAIDRSGGIRFGRAFGQDEILVKHICNHAGGIPSMYDDLIRVIAPQNAHTSSALLLLARFGDVYLDSQFTDGGDGNLYKYELIYYPTTTTDGRPESLKRPQPDEVIPHDIGDLGNDQESYRWFFLLQNNRDRDDYSRFMEFCKKFAAPTAELEARAREVMDVDEWMRAFAMYSLTGIGDTYTQGLDHNNIYYIRPSDNMVLVFPWDMDFAFVRDTGAALWGDRNLARIIARPAFTRMFYRHLRDIIATTYNTAYMGPWATHYGTVCGQDFSSITTYIGQRAANVLGRLPTTIPFEITTSNGEDFSVEALSTVIEGKASIDVAELRLNGDPVAAEWKSTTRWAVTVGLVSGPNVLDFTGVDAAGDAAGADRITVTCTIDYHPPRIDLMVPSEGPSTGGTDVQLFGVNFQPGIIVRFGAVAATSVTVHSEVQLSAVSPPGSGSVAVEVENPDGLTGAAPSPFTYIPVAEQTFKRGDANADGRVDIADAIAILSYLFAQGDIACEDAADVNDDGSINIADAIADLGYIFAKGTPPRAPFEACGPDPTGPDRLDCASFPPCP